MSNSKCNTHLLVEETVHDEEEGALLGVEHYEEHLEEDVGLVQTQDPSAAQDDKLGQDLEHDQPAKTFKRGTARWIRDRVARSGATMLLHSFCHK